MVEYVECSPAEYRQGECNLGVNIRAYREKRGMTRANLARVVGVAPANISYYESGQKTPSVPTLALLAMALRVKTDNLLFGPDHCTAQESEIQ